jgi:hypothetical protein
MFQVCYLDVAFFIGDLNVPVNMNHMLLWVFSHFRRMIINIFNIFLMLQILIFDVTDVEFRCCECCF